MKSLAMWMCMGMSSMIGTTFLAGCGSSPPVHFYMLSAETGSRESAPSGGDVRIAVGPASIPEAVDRPQFVLQNGRNRVTFIEEHRWAESLKNQISRVIADNLGSLLATEYVWAYPQTPAGPLDYRVLVDIHRFDSTPGQTVLIDALWSVKRLGQSDASIKVGRSTVQQPVSGQGYEALAEAFSRGLAAISRDIKNVIDAESAGSRRQ